MRPARTILFPLLVSTLCGSCAVTRVRVPPCKAASAWGTVHADDEELAREVAREVDRVAPMVAGSLPGLEIHPVDLRVVSRISNVAAGPLPAGTTGGSLERWGDRWIEVVGDIGPDDRSRVIAHELVHYWLGPDWKALPPALEDGLCEEIADAVDCGGSAAERLQRFLLTWTSFNGSLRFDQRALPIVEPVGIYTVTATSGIGRVDLDRFREVMGLEQDPFIQTYVDGTGYVVRSLAQILVSRMTLDRLRELCLQASSEGFDRVPAEWILEAARLDPRDATEWNEALEALYGDIERAQLVRTVRGNWCFPLAR